MGCAGSKESAPSNPKRDILYGSDIEHPDQRYLSDPPHKHVQFDSSTKGGIGGTRSSGEAARPKETFEAYAHRGVIRKSALLPEAVQSKRSEHISQKKRVGGYEKYTQE